MTILSKGKGSFAAESPLSGVSDYCHRKNSIGNTIVHRFRHAKEREGERIRRGKWREIQNEKEREREEKDGGTYELSRERMVGNDGKKNKKKVKREREKKETESPRGGRGDWHSRLVKLRWLRMESAGYPTGGQGVDARGG